MRSNDFFSGHKNITVLLAAHNEAAALPALLDSLTDFSIIVVDDGSTDGTKKLLLERGITTLSHHHKSGKGRAIQTGIAHVRGLAQIPDVVVVMDADGQHSMEDVVCAYEHWRDTGADIVLGVRNLYSVTMPLFHRSWNRLVTRIISFVTSYHFSDTQCGLRLFSRNSIREIMLEQDGYEVECEILFWAAKHKKKIAESPVSILYLKKLPMHRGCARAAYILAYVAKKAGIRFFRNIRETLQQEWPLAAGALFLALMSLLLFQALHGIDRMNDVRRYSANMELEAALSWLKKNSREDDIVLSHRVYGHQLVAFAHRRVVLTTKVYPTEFREAARRYTDVGQFFFSENEDDALKRARAYGAAYIFVNKNFSGDFCAGIGRCDLVAERNMLAPWARNTTMIGRMAQGALFEHFQKVWDSPRFVIYKVTDDKQGLTTEAKMVALTIVRQSLKSLLFEDRISTMEDFFPLLAKKSLQNIFDEKRGVDVTFWGSDRTLRASRIETKGTLLENLVSASAKSMHDPRLPQFLPSELKSTRIEVSIFSDAAMSLDPYLIGTNQLRPAKAYLLRAGEAKAIYVPAVFNDRRFGALADFLHALCKKAKLPEECYQDPEVAITMFDTEDFIESDDYTGIYDLSGPMLVEPERFSNKALLSRLIQAGDWILRNQEHTGRFLFRRDALTGVSYESLQLGREAFVEQALLALYNLTGYERYFAAAQRNRTMLQKYIAFTQKHFPEDTALTHYYVFSIFADLDFFRITHDMRYLEDAKEAADLVWGQKDSHLDFGRSFFSFYESNMDTATSSMLNYQALTALAGVAREGVTTQALAQELATIADAYQARFRAKRITEEQQMILAAEAWLPNAFAELYRLTGKKEYADFVFEVSDWLLFFQRSGEPYIDGSFLNAGDSFSPLLMSPRGVGKVAEGLLDAYKIARDMHDVRRATEYKTGLEQAFLWLMRMQITKESNFWGSELSPELVEGGLRHDLFNHEEWSDAAAHFILAGSRFLRMENE